MLIRFYRGYTIETASRLTFKEFSVLQENIIKISEMENPTEENARGRGTAKSMDSPEFQGFVTKKKKPKKRKR